jgi:hypothetical protein
LPAQLGDLFAQPNAAEPSGDARSHWCAHPSLTPDRVAEDLANFLLRTAAVPASATLEFVLYVVIELTHHELSHG